MDAGFGRKPREGSEKGEIPHEAARVFFRQRWKARLSRECELIIEEIKDHQFSSAGLPCEALHSCPLLKEEQTTALGLSKSANDDPDRTISRLDLGRKNAYARVEGIGAELAMKRRGFITLIGGAP